jgi:hypothetical protein
MRYIQEHPDSDSEPSSKAYFLLSAIERCSFVVAIFIVIVDRKKRLLILN